jgi:hypothetical protein
MWDGYSHGLILSETQSSASLNYSGEPTVSLKHALTLVLPYMCVEALQLPEWRNITCLIATKAMKFQSGELEMKKHIHQISPLVLVFASAAVLFAETDHVTAFTGTWKINVAKSTFSPGPPPKSQTVTFAPSGKCTVEGLDAEGKSFGWSFPRSGGAMVPIQAWRTRLSSRRYQAIQPITPLSLGQRIRQDTVRSQKTAKY